jgi:putative membrane protein
VKLSRIIIDAVALIAAALIVPGIKLAWKTDPTQTLITLVVLAFVFGVINAYVRPVLRAVSLPVNLISMGLFSFFLNAGLLLLLAWLVDQLWQPLLTIGGFPPDVSSTTLSAAVMGSLVITAVSTFMSVLLPDA